MFNNKCFLAILRFKKENFHNCKNLHNDIKISQKVAMTDVVAMTGVTEVTVEVVTAGTGPGHHVTGLGTDLYKGTTCPLVFATLKYSFLS